MTLDLNDLKDINPLLRNLHKVSQFFYSLYNILYYFHFKLTEITKNISKK